VGRAADQEIPSVAGWQAAQPTPGTHRVGTGIGAAHEGRGYGKIVGTRADGNARAAFIQEFFGKTALKPSRTYRYSVSYRSEGPLAGSGSLLIDSYTAEGEKGRKTLVSRKLVASGDWKTLTGEIVVPDMAIRVRMLLYLHGKGTICFDDAFLGDRAVDAPNLLKNGGFEPPGSYVYDLAPEKRSGSVKFVAGFDGASMGTVKQLGPDEFYIYAFAQNKPHSSFLWFFFRVEDCQGRELTIHVNPAPFSRKNTGGNGTRSPVVSYDCDRWLGVTEKSWNADGTVLTFKHRCKQPQAWLASFFPFTAEHSSRFAASHKVNPCFHAGVVGKSREGRPIPLLTITDPAVSEAEKRVVIFITLQHDLETTGAMAVEGICRFLLSADPRAARLRRMFVFYVIPMMDPDGIAGGNLYCPAGNMNRQWGLGTAPETTSVERFAKSLTAKGRKIELFMDFHGWCTAERTTEFLTFGPKIAGEESARDALLLVAAIKPRLSGKVLPIVWHNWTDYVGTSETLRHLSCGWMQMDAPARLAFSIEIFGEGECTQEQYLSWGQAFAEGMAEFYGAAR
jgi:hypothetical protein